MQMCYIVTVICLTLVALAYIGSKKDRNQEEKEEEEK